MGKTFSAIEYTWSSTNSGSSLKRICLYLFQYYSYYFILIVFLWPKCKPCSNLKGVFSSQILLKCIGDRENIWVNIFISVHWFISTKAHVHVGSTLQNSVYKRKVSSSDLTDLPNQFCCFTTVCQWSLLRYECKTKCIRSLISDWLIV